MYPRGGARTVNVANLTNGYAAEKGISKVVSDGEWKLYVHEICLHYVCKLQTKYGAASIVRQPYKRKFL